MTGDLVFWDGSVGGRSQMEQRWHQEQCPTTSEEAPSQDVGSSRKPHEMCHAAFKRAKEGVEEMFPAIYSRLNGRRRKMRRRKKPLWALRPDPTNGHWPFHMDAFGPDPLFKCGTKCGNTGCIKTSRLCLPVGGILCILLTLLPCLIPLEQYRFNQLPSRSKHEFLGCLWLAELGGY